MPTKQRVLGTSIPRGKHTQRNKSKGTTTINPNGAKNVTVEGGQTTSSEGHARSKNGKYMSGGPFFTTKLQHAIPTRDVTIDPPWTNNLHNKYEGPIFVPTGQIPDSTNGKISIPSPGGDSYLDPIGAEAIARTNPMNPNADLGVALGELVRDRIPVPIIRSWKDRTRAAQFAGSEYLNAVFGWLPLIDEIKDVSQSVLDGNTILENYRSASGTLVHREFAFPDSESVSETKLSGTHRAQYVTGSSVGEWNGTGVEITRTEVSRTRRWFSGSYTYHASQAPSVAKMIGYGSEAEKLFGLSLTPDLVWELTPWSWAIDWFSNAGDVISNATYLGAAGLVLKYGYIMEETSRTITYSMPSTGLTGVTGSVPPCIVTQVTKRRREANPFGFGLSWDGLSPTQLAITAALGITRLR